MSSRVATLSGNGDRLRQGLSALTRALWLSETLVWLVRGLAAGLVGSVLMLGLARFIDVPTWAAAATGILGILVGGAIAAMRPRSFQRTALQADLRLGLRERLTTAWEIQQRGFDSPLAVAQMADTLARLRDVKPFRAFPLRLPRRESAAAAGLLVVALALLTLPNPHRLDVQRQQAERKLISQQAQAVAQLAQQIQTSAGSQPNAQQAATVQALQQLQQALNDKTTTTAQAMSDLAAAEDRLRAQDSGAATAAKGGLDQAAAALAASQDGAALTKDLAQSIGQGQYAQAANQLQQLANQAPSLSQQQRDALQSTLNAAGASAAKSDPALGQALQQAANSLGSASQPGNAAAQQQAFNQAAAALQQAGQSVTADSQNQQALSQVQASEASLSNAQQAASGQNPTAQAGGQGSQAQQVTSLSSDAGAAPQAGAQTAVGSSTDSASAGAQAGGGQAGGADQGGAQSQQAGDAGQAQAQASGQSQSGQGQSGQSGNGNGGQGGSGGHGNGGGPSDQVYAPPSSVNGHQVQLPNSATGPGQQITANGAQNPENNQALVPYNQVIGSYQQQAAQAMDQSHVPLDKKNLVRDYFSSLAAGN